MRLVGTIGNRPAIADQVFAEMPADLQAFVHAMTAFVIGWTMFAGLVLLLATAAEVRGVP